MALDPSRITAAIEATKLKRAEIARRLKISPQSIYSWEKTGRIGHTALLGLARLAKMRVEDIADQDAIQTDPLRVYDIKTDEDEPEDGDVTVDVADIKLAAGDHSDAPAFVETKHRHTFKMPWLRSMGVRRPDAVKRCAVVGRSMEPTLWDGDMATINTDAKEIVDDEVYAVVVGRKLQVKRLSRRRDGSLEIRSDNKDYPTEIVMPEDLDQIHIIGQVFDRSGPGGLRR